MEARRAVHAGGLEFQEKLSDCERRCRRWRRKTEFGEMRSAGGQPLEWLRLITSSDNCLEAEVAKGLLEEGVVVKTSSGESLPYPRASGRDGRRRGE